MIKFVFNRNLLVRFILFIFILNQYLLSQSLNFQHLSLQDGLSQNCIYSILQDSKGLIWLGTQDGLNKFDGYNFTVINQDLVEKNKLTDSHILCLYEDNKPPN